MRNKAVRRPIEGVLKALQAQWVAIDRELEQFIRNSPIWRVQEDLLPTVPGVGPVLARTLTAELPELGKLSPKAAAAEAAALGVPAVRDAVEQPLPRERAGRGARDDGAGDVGGKAGEAGCGRRRAGSSAAVVGRTCTAATRGAGRRRESWTAGGAPGTGSAGGSCDYGTLCTTFRSAKAPGPWQMGQVSM
ncbi:MAG: hypothetical protein HY423_07835 [Candidatus Lambdaproteobacteria bacterium]|nr:hypothetical protein [Candidatus Lambdaproteobacteria bacterium]